MKNKNSLFSVNNKLTVLQDLRCFVEDFVFHQQVSKTYLLLLQPLLQDLQEVTPVRSFLSKVFASFHQPRRMLRLPARVSLTTLVFPRLLERAFAPIP